MNIYDFDNTIYKGDSTADFIMWSIRRKPTLIFKIATCVKPFFAYLAKRGTKTAFKEKMYSFLQNIEDIDSELEEFWGEYIVNIKDWYKKQQREDDLIISASPEFLLRPVCKRIGIKHLMASRVDKKTGFYTGENCYGKEKVRRFYEEYEGGAEEFYSDSKSDAPLAEISKTAYLVDDDKISEWK